MVSKRLFEYGVVGLGVFRIEFSSPRKRNEIGVKERKLLLFVLGDNYLFRMSPFGLLCAVVNLVESQDIMFDICN